MALLSYQGATEKYIKMRDSSIPSRSHNGFVNPEDGVYQKGKNQDPKAKL